VVHFDSTNVVHFESTGDSLLSSLAYRPELLVLDEPFSGLDPLVREELTDGILAASAQEGGTVLVSSHDIEDIERLAEHVSMIDGGRLMLSESTDSLLGRFREVEIIGGAERAGPPPGASGWESSGGRSRFVAPDFSGAASEEVWRARYPGATFRIEPMTLRGIFVVLARTWRGKQEGADA